MCVWRETKGESKRSAAFVFQIRLMDLAQIKSLRGIGYALRAVLERVCGENVCSLGGGMQ